MKTTHRGFVGIMLMAAVAAIALTTAVFSVIQQHLKPAPQETQQTQPIGAALPSGTAVFETSLQTAISSSATSMTLASNSVRGGGTLSGYNCFTIDEGSSQAEYVCGTVSSTSVTGMTRGVDPITATTTNATLQFAHRRGVNVKITDFPLVQIMRNQLNGSETIPNLLNYTYDNNFLTASTSALVTLGQLNRTAFGSATVGVNFGGTGQTSLPQNMILVGNGTSAVTSTSSPTVGYITATSTTGTSTFGGNIKVNGQETVASSTIYTLNVGSVNATSTILLNGVSFAGSATSTTFLATGANTWTKPANAVKVLVQLWGAGASGAKGSNTAGGGGGGEYSEFTFNASDLGSTETVTIGAGGAARTTNGSGNDGGNTTFGSWLTSYGGKGGTSQNSGTASQGGHGGTKLINLNGLWGIGVVSASGGFGNYSAAGGGTDTSSNGYAGGNSYFGGAGGGGESDVGTSFGDGAGGTSVRGGNAGAGHRNGNAVDGSTPGGGGGAVSGTGNTGKGGDGKAIITTFF